MNGQTKLNNYYKRSIFIKKIIWDIQFLQIWKVGYKKFSEYKYGFPYLLADKQLSRCGLSNCNSITEEFFLPENN